MDDLQTPKHLKVLLLLTPANHIILAIRNYVVGDATFNFLKSNLWSVIIPFIIAVLLDYHLDRAIDACLNIRKKLKSCPTENNFVPKVSIGINSGEMVSGNIGSAILRRLDFTVIGDTVNTAQRLQTQAGQNQIMINETCYEKVKLSFDCKEVGKATLKNKEGQVLLFEVLN